MRKRTVILGDYDTAAHGWTLTGLKLSDPEQKLQYVDKPGGDGSWDISTVLTDGIPRYKNRDLLITLECSEGSRDDREKLINTLVNDLDGLERPVLLPDRPDHYLTGRLHVAVEYSDWAHAAVTVTGTCAPWFFSVRETIVELEAIAEDQTEYIRNSGRRAAVPAVTVTGTAKLSYRDYSVTLEAGSHDLPNFLILPGSHELTYSGSGTITISYREAVLR